MFAGIYPILLPRESTNQISCKRGIFRRVQDVLWLVFWFDCQKILHISIFRLFFFFRSSARGQQACQSVTDNYSHQSSFYCLYRVVCTTSSLFITHKASQSLTDNHSHQSSFYCLYRVVCIGVITRVSWFLFISTRSRTSPSYGDVRERVDINRNHETTSTSYPRKSYPCCKSFNIRHTLPKNIMLIGLQSTFTVKSQWVKYRVAVTKKRSCMVSLTGISYLDITALCYV